MRPWKSRIEEIKKKKKSQNIKKKSNRLGREIVVID